MHVRKLVGMQAVLVLGAVIGGCEDGKTGSMCVTAGRLDASGTRVAPDGLGGEGDLKVQSDVLTAVFAAVDRPVQIAASGGTLIDLYLNGRSDHMNEYSQIAGADQALQVAYTSMQVVEQDGQHVVVESSGHVQPQPPSPGGAPAVDPDPGTDVTYVTRYEVRCGEPLVHVRSTLTNTGSQAYATSSGWGIMDVMLWGTRSLLPFCPGTGQGLRCPSFDISNPIASLVFGLYVGSSGSIVDDPGTFAFYLDDPAALQFIGVHDDQVSAFGDPKLFMTSLEPSDGLSLERAIAIGDRADVASATDIAFDALAAAGRMDVGTVTGRVVPPAGEALSADPYQRPTVLLATPPATGDPTDATNWTPRTLVRVAADGGFSARMPAGAVAWELRAPSHPRVAMEAGTLEAGGSLDLGDLALSPLPELRVSVRDVTGGGSSSLPAKVVVLGASGTPDPSFGRADGASPAGNVALTDGEGDVALRLPEGTYDVYATHGPFWTLARAQGVTVTANGANVSLDLQKLDVLPSGFLAGDFHVHSAASFDSSLPITDRVRAYIAAGVDAIIATDHDVIFDFAPALSTVEASMPPAWRGKLRTFVGIESTANVPWADYPHTIGHHNAFPLTVQEGMHKNGAPEDEYVSVGTLYERLRALPSPVDVPIVQLNHARSSRDGSIYLGYFDACGFDPTAPVDPDGPCFADVGPMGTRAWSFDAMEVMNGKDSVRNFNMSRDWYSLLRQAPGGDLPTGTANSDSHRLLFQEAGYPVNVLHTGGTLDTLDDQALVDIVRAHRASGALGVFAWAVARPAGTNGPGAEPGDTATITGDVDLEVSVAAAPWIPVQQIRILQDGVVIDTLSPTTTPTDPFGTDGVVRYSGTVTVPALAADGFLTVEAGFALPTLEDTNGDGQLDLDLGPAPMPFGAVVVDGHPEAFTNPIFIDVDGNGVYDPPGTPLPQL